MVRWTLERGEGVGAAGERLWERGEEVAVKKRCQDGGRKRQLTTSA